MKKNCILALAAATLALLLSCAETPKAAGEQAALVYGSGDYASINPALYEHGEINSLLFAGLTQRDANNKTVPAIAESWEWDANRLVYTFNLRDGVLFHDGEQVTSEDVKFTIEAIQNPANGSEIASNYEEIESVDAIGPLTVEIKLSAPNAALPDYMSIGLLPKHLLEGKDLATDSFNQRPIGAGPYKLAEWDMGQSIAMEAYDGFYLGKPKIETVVFKIVEDDSARALQLRSGELTLAQVAPKDAERFKADPAFQVYDMATADYRGIMYNFGHAFWQANPGLPAALSYAIDRQAIVDSVLLGQGEAAYSPIQKGEYANSAINHYDYSPEKAQEAIEALGWAKGANGYYQKGGEELGFALSVRPSDQVRVDMANIASQNLKDIGVNCAVEISEKIDWAGQSAFLIGWGSPFDPDDHTYKVFGTGKGSNYSGFSDPEYDRILLEARSTEDSAQRHSLYSSFQEIWAENPAYTLIAYIDALYVSSNLNLKGISESTALGHHGVGIFWNIYEWTLS
jgi:peptide/nickel transport system substrate-binding protein